MINKTNKTTYKQLPKGQRTNVRGLKQDARKAGGTYKQANQKANSPVKKA